MNLGWIKKLLWPKLKVKVSDIEGILDALDKDVDGYISADELIDWIKTLGVKI